MHQIRLRLGLRPDPQCPDPLAGFKGPTSKGRRVRQGRGRVKGKGEREGRDSGGENGKVEEGKEEGRERR